MGPCDACGWAGAFMSMLGFGSFGAPIKSEASKSVDIDPLVFQTYKTFMCFITSWLVLAFGEPLSFTPWGIVSACFWVPSGVAAIAGIKMAGLAVAMGTLSSFIVLVSFTWGIFVFDERIHSRKMACFAILLMMMGLVGMSYFSSPETVQQSTNDSDSQDPVEEFGDSSEYIPLADEEEAPSGTQEGHDQHTDTEPTESVESPGPDLDGAVSSEPLLSTTTDESENAIPSMQDEAPPVADKILVCGISVKRRHAGIACSVFCGVWGGSIMAPEKLAKANTSGVGYLISFGIGATIVTAALWALRFLYHYQRLGTLAGAYYSLPSFHIRVMWLPGCTAGALWSIGNFFSLISVKYLGEGVGYSVTQSAMLVSGLWGIFYFKEITRTQTIVKWFLSAGLTVSGIILLSYEHEEK